MRYRFKNLFALLPTLVWACSSVLVEPKGQPPEVSIVGPPPWATFLRGEVVDLEVTASDTDGAVVAVWLYLDGRRLGVDSASPYQFQWETRGERLGPHSVRAVAEDKSGLLSEDKIGLRLRWGDFAPEQLDDGWETSRAGVEGIDVGNIAATMEKIDAGGWEFLHAILMVRNGKLVFEEYFGDFGRDSLQHVQSTTKSFTSSLVGIAIDRGEINSVDDVMLDYLPQYAQLRDADNERITIRHCLMMAAGLQWNEVSVPPLESYNDNMVGHLVPDYVAYFLAKPSVAVPGTEYYYNSGCPLTLGAILRSAAGVPADAYAEQYLFGPLGISDFSWPSINYGKHVGTHGSLYIRPRDMAKFGQLFLQQGVWDGERIISAEWVAQSTEPRLTVFGDVRYGYQWWFKEMNGYDVPFTSGHGGQHIFVVPELETIIVTATGYSDASMAVEQQNRLINLVEYRIVPAVGSHSAEEGG